MTISKINAIRILKIISYCGLVYLSYLMVLISIQYIPVRFDVAFLAIKQDEISIPYYQISFFTHVYTAIFTLLLGFFQFSKRLRKKYPKFHQASGKLYIGLIVLFAGPSGFVMGIHANGGIYSQISFCLLSLLWVYFTIQAYRNARKKEWKLHSKFIYRSYALTLSALSLRLFKWVIASTIALPPMDIYKIVAWGGWLVNLLIAELIILNEDKKLVKTEN
ncbi:DUF2306 domain-containing protein [Flagellimonas iocasae]|uniref:DUF2306 domain-containing protein n=1 Tax=Flagellimonas iocasae TaxID=2055905 RepID=A0ABW4XYV0_9FLAO